MEAKDLDLSGSDLRFESWGWFWVGSKLKLAGVVDQRLSFSKVIRVWRWGL
jgi:hypothetical protein